MDNKRFSLKESNGFFMIMALVFLTIGAYVQYRWRIMGFVITEYVILLLPVLIYAWITKKDIKRSFKLKKIPIPVVIRIVVLAFFLIPIVALSNLLAMYALSTFTNLLESPIPEASSALEFMILFFVIAVSAGICEEFFFRGMMMDALENESTLKTAAIFSALMFALFHFNPQNFIGPFILGIVFAYLTQITGSIWAAVVAHIANNGIAVTMGFISKGITEQADAVTVTSMFDDPQMMLYMIQFYVVLAAFSVLGSRGILKGIKQYYPRYHKNDRFILNQVTYHVLNNDNGCISFFNEAKPEDIMTVDEDVAKRKMVTPLYQLWSNQSLQLPKSTAVAIAYASVLFGLIIKLAYFT